MDKKEIIQAGIIGGAGYTGGELIRLLINHPHTNLKYVHSRSNAGKHVAHIHTDLVGDADIYFTDDLNVLSGSTLDVLFLCSGHSEAVRFLNTNEIHPDIKIIDLSHDFRLKSSSEFQHPNNPGASRNFIYGLPELNREAIKKAGNIANPGCFATAIQLGLLPLAKHQLLTDIYTTGITGSTGAGQGFSSTSHFSWRANNIQAYKTLEHQHLKEIYQSLNQLHPAFPGTPEGNQVLNFVPWRGDFTRGIFISSQMHCDLSLEELLVIYNVYYRDEPFVKISNDSISLKQTVNTNKCVIQLEKVGSKLVVHSTLDNLLKGASGQAVQNMNLLFGIKETAGLILKASTF
jgi:N-acetyl-gamma-glutamyl-phosphate reductase